MTRQNKMIAHVDKQHSITLAQRQQKLTKLNNSHQRSRQKQLPHDDDEMIEIKYVKMVFKHTFTYTS